MVFLPVTLILGCESCDRLLTRSLMTASTLCQSRLLLESPKLFATCHTWLLFAEPPMFVEPCGAG